jgi:DNA-binding NtrC family response regulator
MSMGPSSLPLLRVAAQRDRQGRPSGETQWRHSNGHSGLATILVIEDEVLIRLAVCDYLRDVGYRVVEGSTAEEAQRVFRAGEPVDVLFSDIHLGPGLDGVALAKWVRQHFPQVHILLASGHAKAEQPFDVGHGPFFHKPYSYEALEMHIRQLTDLFDTRSG